MNKEILLALFIVIFIVAAAICGTIFFFTHAPTGKPEKNNDDILHLYVRENGEVKEYFAVDRELHLVGELPSKVYPQIIGKIIAHQTGPPEYKHIGFTLSTVRIKHLDEQLGLLEKKEGGEKK
jgi:hypothetical protein